jgi:hypothetical protein
MSGRGGHSSRCQIGAVIGVNDMEMPADTFRAWTIGLFWAIFIPGLNQIFQALSKSTRCIPVDVVSFIEA